MIRFKKKLSGITTDNLGSARWWRDRVILPYVFGTVTRFHPRYPGYNDAISVMNEDWDTLIILDSCGADLFSEAVDLNIFDSHETVVSLGSHSSEWTRRNFVEKTFNDTVYVSANPHTSLLAGEVFYHIEEMWDRAETKPNEMHPAKMVQATKEAHQQHPHKRLIVHFMQPHGTGGLVETQESKQKTHENTIQAMVEYILDIHEHANGKTVVTADHGELYNGGIKAWLGLEGHKPRLRIPQLVCVPWAELYGDRRLIESGSISEVDASRGEIRKGLRELGYLD